MPRTVYRIEYEDGDGPYQRSRRNGDTLTPERARISSEMVAKHRDNEHPTMWGDCFWSDVKSNRYSSSEYFCGFISLTQYRAWFDEFI